MDPKADVDEHLPNEVVDELLAILFLDVSGEVPVLAILHYDVDFSIIDE